MFKRKYIYINLLLLVCTVYLGVIFKASILEENLEFEKKAADIILNERKKVKKSLEREIPDWDFLSTDKKATPEKYLALSEKNLFRPDRKEWVPPPPPPPAPPTFLKTDKKEKVEEEETKTPDLPDPFLYGIVVAGKKRLAIMRGYSAPKQAEKRFREITSVSGKRQRFPIRARRRPKATLAKKSSIYGVSDYIGDAKILAIEKNFVRLKRDSGAPFEVRIFDKSIKKPAAVSAKRRPRKTRVPNWRNRHKKTSLFKERHVSGGR